MKRLMIGVLSLAALVVLTLAPAVAVTGNCCPGQQCCGHPCCHNHSK